MSGVCAGLKVLAATAAVLVIAAMAGAGTAAAAATPACAGAAARDAARPCSNPTLSIVPKPGADETTPEAPCKPTHEQPSPICTFGASAKRARSHIALVGDSHALHWRQALNVVARAQRWRGHSLTAPGCPFSEAVSLLPEGLRAPCEDWYAQVRKWFRRHPEVTTVFVSQIAPLAVVIAPGKTYYGVKSTGFRNAWKALPRTVKKIIVIRDTPETSQAQTDCVKRVFAEGTQPAGPACAVPRSVALRFDPAITTARSIGSKRYQAIDLSDFFCDATSCFPVVGGVRVYEDVFGHITLAYSQSLGRYLLRGVRRLMAAR